MIEDGTVTAALLLVNVRLCPPLGAAAFSTTVQEVVVGPTREVPPQDNDPRIGTPVPLRLIDADEALLATVRVPLVVPAAVGPKDTLSVVD